MRLLTIPNALSLLRIAGIPLFVWLLLGPHQDVLALIVLAVAAVTDWLDGKLARWLNQTSRFGAMLDPAADRLYVLATLVAFVIRGIVPLWFALVLAIRDIAVGLCLLLLRRAGYRPPEVLYLGKAATFSLLYALPLLLFEQGNPFTGVIAPISYALAGWGAGLYLWSGLLYLWQAIRTLRNRNSANVSE